MKLTFFSNYINHHQIPLANEFYSILGDDYVFVANEEISNERLRLGYLDQNKSFPYVLTTYDSEENKKKAEELIIDSDIVIVGSASDDIMNKRLPTGKITFHSSERYFKNAQGFKDFPRNFISAMKHIKRYDKFKNYFYLCMSAYTAYDICKYANYQKRMFKWGYFPEYKPHDIENLISTKSKNNKISILWVGRFIEWKHPELSILLSEFLRNKGYEFKLQIIGTGELESGLKKMINEKKLDEYVSLLGAMPPTKVRNYMEDSEIFIFTSDFNEGWGAVLNEAMNSGCAIVASHAIGAVPFLVKNYHNGLIYENGNIQDFFHKVEYLIINPKKKRELAINAYKSIADVWNCNISAERFLNLVDSIMNGNNESNYACGPCSKAEIIKNCWYKA